MAIEYLREEDGRWLADIPVFPGVTSYLRTKKRATAAVQALALHLVANRLEHSEALSASPNWPFPKAKRALAAVIRIGWHINRQSGTLHRILERSGWPDVLFA